MREIDALFVHCSDASDHLGPRVIDRWHKDRGWSGIGYHRVVWCSEGRWVASDGRALDQAGAHVAGANSRTIGVCLAGRYDQEAPPQAAYDALVPLLAVLAFDHGLEADRVFGHREAELYGAPPTPKTCPGSAFDLDDLRERVRVLLQAMRVAELR